MTQEEKQLVFNDLCARLPYGVRVKIFDESILLYEHNENGTLDGKETISGDNFVIKGKNDSWIISCEDFKPYLRPMSSMTEEEYNEFSKISGLRKKEEGNYFSNHLPEWGNSIITERVMVRTIDWLNKNGFDYRGLIPMGLALEAKEEMYKF